jgi:hypothetical protein
MTAASLLTKRGDGRQSKAAEAQLSSGRALRADLGNAHRQKLCLRHRGTMQPNRPSKRIWLPSAPENRYRLLWHLTAEFLDLKAPLQRSQFARMGNSWGFPWAVPEGKGRLIPSPLRRFGKLTNVAYREG